MQGRLQANTTTTTCSTRSLSFACVFPWSVRSLMYQAMGARACLAMPCRAVSPGVNARTHARTHQVTAAHNRETDDERLDEPRAADYML